MNEETTVLIEEFQLLENKTEALWREAEVKTDVWGYQIQKGSLWNPGLTEAEIRNFEEDLRVEFPNVLKCFLSDEWAYSAGCQSR